MRASWVEPVAAVASEGNQDPKDCASGRSREGRSRVRGAPREQGGEVGGGRGVQERTLGDAAAPRHLVASIARDEVGLRALPVPRAADLHFRQVQEDVAIVGQPLDRVTGLEHGGLRVDERVGAEDVHGPLSRHVPQRVAEGRVWSTELDKRREEGPRSLAGDRFDQKFEMISRLVQVVDKVSVRISHG